MNKSIQSVACVLLLMLTSFSAFSQTTLISKNAEWKYLDDGSNQGTSWRNTSFNDASWDSADGIFGYGTLDGASITTTIDDGGNSSNVYITTYFRKKIVLSNPAYTSLTLNLLCDDGAVIYVNGNQVYSYNMPGTFGYTTTASSAISSTDEGDYTAYNVSASNLVNGVNVIAVEIHQSGSSSSDVGFDLQVLGSTTVVSDGDTWNYYDVGSTPTGSWKTDTNYSLSGWGSGPSELGYGDSDEATTVGFGGNSTDKYTTTYFYKKFQIADTANVDFLRIQYVRDDGIVVYINGEELIRDNMPTGTIYNYTNAISALGGSDESDWNTEIVAPTTLYQGSNVVAVQIHQADSTSSDISFNMTIEAIEAPVPTITRGPYIQNTTDTSAVIMWLTDVPSKSAVKFGKVLSTYDSLTVDATATASHELKLSNLEPNTKYYYYVSTDGSDTLSGYDGTYYFQTHPIPGNDDLPVRFWVLGDQGQPGADQDSVHSKFYQQSYWKDSMDFIMMLGDNAYNSGLDAEFEAAVFQPLGEVIRNKAIFSCVGNHEVRYVSSHSISTPSTTPYYLIHNFPTQGEGGGVPSNTESYYSFDYGHVHFICLNAEEEDLDSTTSAMWSWCEQDLQQNTQLWVVVYVHQGPYTKGTHNSDTETEHVDFRLNFLPLLERYGADLTLSGHSHSYERSKFVKGHFGTSGTYSSSSHDIDGGYGRMPNFGSLTNDCPYTKVTTGPTAGYGAVYITAGSSSKSGNSYGLNHPVMKVSYSTKGSCFVEVTENRLDYYYLESNGNITDYFTMLKDVEYDSTETLTDTTVTLTASWPDGPWYWSTGETTRSIVVNTKTDSLLTVGNTSTSPCIVDSFFLDFPRTVRYPFSKDMDTSGLLSQDADGSLVLRGDEHTDADANGWYYYYNSNDTDALLFAVRNSLSGGNSNPIDNVIDYIELRYAPSAYSRLVSGTDSFNMVMNFDWNVVSSSSPNGDMDVKFYYDPAIMASFTAITDSIESTNGDLESTLRWFKANQGSGQSFLNANILVDTIENSTNLNGLLVSAPNYTTGVASADGSAWVDQGNGKNFVQINGLSSFSGGGFSESLFDPTPVPVSWLSFDVYWNGKDASLVWQTASENNNAYFVVERRIQGDVFVPIAEIKGAGNSVGINSYSYLDANASKFMGRVVEYRVKQLDFDGNSSYSETRQLALSSGDEISLYPSPVSQVLTFSLNNQNLEEAQVVVIIYDANGRVQSNNKIALTSEMKLDVRDLAEGVYFMNVLIDDHLYIRKFIKN